MVDLRPYRKAAGALDSAYRAHFGGLGGYHSEILPERPYEVFKIDRGQLEKLHQFMESNPFIKRVGRFGHRNRNFIGYEYSGEHYYYRASNDSVLEDGEIFVPSWLMSSWLLANLAKDLGYKEFVDIGSGYGNVPYCAKLAGLRGVGIEIQPHLIETQNIIRNKTGVDFKIHQADAISFDFGELDLQKPLFTHYAYVEPEKLEKETGRRISFCLWNLDLLDDELDEGYKVLAKIRLPTHWGRDINFIIYRQNKT